MANSVVTASLSVSFQATETSGDGYLSWEVDDRVDGLNGGDTSFAPGDTAYLLLFQEANVTIDETFTSAGTLAKSGGKQVYSFKGDKTEYITVTNSNTANLAKPANIGAPTLSWLGKSKKVNPKGIAKLEMKTTTVGTNKTTSQVIIDLGTEMVGVIKAEYDSEAEAYKLSGVPEDFPIAVVFSIGTINS